MAIGLKYFARYRDKNKLVKEIRFFKSDHVGPATEWHCGMGAVDYSLGSSDSFFPDKPIITSQARISLVFQQQYDLTEFVYDRRTFFTEIVVVETDKIEWSGWVEPWDSARPYQKPPYPVSLMASCGLAHLAKTKYKNPNTTFKKTGLALIQECLASIGSQLNLRVSTHMMHNGFADDAVFGLRSFESNTARYFNENGETLYCDVILNDILNHFTAELIQWDNRWVVRSIVDHATGFERSFHEFPFGDGPVTGSKPWPGVYIVNDSSAWSKDGGQIRILAPITKYRTEVDLGRQNPYFENGDMFVWTAGGLVGWDFTHMPKGNPGWEQFVINQETGQSVLKINGTAPGPYTKKKKKKLVNVLGAIATGLVGANLKSKSYDLEPTEWIESSVGRISKGDKTLKISFDYYTAPNSSNIMFSIRLINRLYPGKDQWVAPGVENAGTWPEFKFILAPPVTRENLIYRGDLNVSGNPNYPSGTTVNWTYVVSGVPAGEVRRIGGPLGIPVENDDLVISKISNPGGTHAAVGDRWQIIHIKNDTKRGTFETTVLLDKINLVSDKFANDPLPFEEVVVRFYKITSSSTSTGDWYKIYNLKGALEGFVPSSESGQYSTTLERGSKTDEEAQTINLITGDYNPWFSGALTIPGSIQNTSSWRRRPDLEESLSIYRAMMLDRLCMTSRPLTVMEGEIMLMPESGDLSYLHTIVLADKGNMRMRIVRYSYNDYRRIATVTAIEVKYEEIPAGELRQDSFITGQGPLNTIPGQGDGIYPTKEDTSSGRIGIDDASPTPEELEESINSGGRLGLMFEDVTPLTYIVGIKSEDSVDLADFISEAFNEINADQEPEDMFDTTTLVLTLTEKPVWLTGVDVDVLEITATAFAPKTGTFYAYFDATDPVSGLVFPVRVPILVEPSEDFIDEWPPVLLDVPPMYFIVGTKKTNELDLVSYLDPDGLHDGTGLRAELVSKPGWVSETTVINMGLSVTGTSTVAGTDYVSFEFSDAVGNVKRFTFVLISVEKAVFDFTLVDANTPNLDLIGKIPGAYKVPDKYDVLVKSNIRHNKFQIKVNAGSDPDANILVEDTQEVVETSIGNYRAFSFENGRDGLVGLYRAEFAEWIGDFEIGRSVVFYTLYDEAFLAKLRFELWGAAAKIGDILVNEITKFKMPDSFNPKAIVVGIPHDKVVLTLDFEGQQIKQTEIVIVAASYSVYTTALILILAGLYRLNAKFYLAGILVYERQSDFIILPKPAVADAGITVVEMIPGSVNYKVIQEVPLKGTELDLPVNGYNFLVTDFGVEVDFVSWEFFNKVSNQFVIVDVPRYTKKENYVVYSQLQTTVEILTFWGFSSLDIGDIHTAPSDVRIKFTGRTGGEQGDIVAIKQADVAFRIPLLPGDYSGLRFIYLDDAGNELIDGNMPRAGRKYILPQLPKHYTVSFRHLPDFEEFDEFKTQYKKNGVVLHGFGSDYVDRDTILPTTELTSDTIARIWGFGTGVRTLDNPANVAVSIDEPGLYEATFTIYREGVEIAVLDTEYELVEDVDIPQVPEADCCEASSSFTQIIGDGVTTVFNIPHNLDTFNLHVTIRKTTNRQEVFVANEATTSNNVVVTFYAPPAAGSRVVIIEKA